MTEASPARANMGYIGAIVAVATIGGFMFSYDSGVIDGTQEGLEQAFSLSALGTGVNVGAILIGCAIGAFVAGRLTDVIGRRNVWSSIAITTHERRPVTRTAPDQPRAATIEIRAR